MLYEHGWAWSWSLRYIYGGFFRRGGVATTGTGGLPERVSRCLQLHFLDCESDARCEPHFISEDRSLRGIYSARWLASEPKEIPHGDGKVRCAYRGRTAATVCERATSFVRAGAEEVAILNRRGAMPSRVPTKPCLGAAASNCQPRSSTARAWRAGRRPHCWRLVKRTPRRRR